jgi:hypothetical protein
LPKIRAPYINSVPEATMDRRCADAGRLVATSLFVSQAGTALGTGGGATEGVIDRIRLALFVGAASVTATIVPSLLRGR